MFVVTDTSIRPEGDRPAKVWPVSGFLGSRDPLWKPTQTQEQLCTASKSVRRLWSTGDAGKTPADDPWQQRLAKIICGKLIYQEIPTSIGFSSYDTAVTAWKDNDGIAAQKYALESFWLEQNYNSIIGNRSEYFSVRLMGYVCPEVSGQYTFYAQDDDTCALRVGDTKGYLNSWSYDYRKFFTMSMTADKWYMFDFIFQQGSGGRFYNVGWTTPNSTSITRIPVANFGYKAAQLAPDFTY